MCRMRIFMWIDFFFWYRTDCARIGSTICPASETKLKTCLLFHLLCFCTFHEFQNSFESQVFGITRTLDGNWGYLRIRHLGISFLSVVTFGMFWRACGRFWVNSERFFSIPIVLCHSKSMDTFLVSFCYCLASIEIVTKWHLGCQILSWVNTSSSQIDCQSFHNNINTP